MDGNKGAIAPKQLLSVPDGVFLVAGMVIGVGIFKLPGLVAGAGFLAALALRWLDGG